MIHHKALHHPNFGLLILRLAVGLVFMYEGYLKLHGMTQTIMFFHMIGLGAFWAWVTALVELIGGFMMIAGYGIQLAGLLLTIVMIVAVTKVAGSEGFMLALGPIMLGIAALSLTFSGSGKYGFDNSLSK